MMNDSPTYTSCFDGATEPINPGGIAGFGAVVHKGKQLIWLCSEIYLPQSGQVTSNNLAEYAGLTKLLTFFNEQELTSEHIEIFGDSRLVINQMFGIWKIGKGLYTPLAFKAKEILSSFTDISGRWIPRELNTVADNLSRQAIQNFQEFGGGE